LADNLIGCLGLKTLFSTIIVVKNDSHVDIADYTPKTGGPLNQPTVKNAIVSYEYRDQPAYLLCGDPPNRYHVLGTLEQDHDGERLAIVSVNRAKLEEAAKLLRQRGLGVKEMHGAVEYDRLTPQGDYFNNSITSYLHQSRVGIFYSALMR
jgi:hypothetical protein